MTRRSWFLVALAALLLSVGVAAVVGSATTTVLVVVDADGTELLEVPVEPGTEVTIEYTHSVERTTVTDVYVVDDGALVSERMLFSSFGAGLPSNADVTRTGDRYLYHPPAQRHTPLTVSTGPVADHDLVVDGQRYDLAGMTDDGTARLHIETRLGR